ncbi:hypothetical protein HZC30_08070 [Candidatus Woesearchaeota archaeon]|nr:hypothetical protein [Candidatus Woesearchaeota archaeon]
MEPNTQNRGTLTNKESFILSDLAKKNKNIFTIKDLKVYDGSAKKISYSLAKKKWILKLKRDLFAIVPLDVGTKGAGVYAVPNLVIPQYLVKKYYISYGSALNYHGFSEQLLREVFVAINKAKKPVTLIDSKITFIHLKNEKFFGIEKIKVKEKEVEIADKEKTIIDCLEKPQYCGGIEEVARAIYFNFEELDLNQLIEYGKKMNNSCVLKRLGYLLEKLKGITIKAGFAKNYCWLDPLGKQKGKYNNKWKIIINARINPPGWEH